MDIKPIFKTLIRNPVGLVLIATQVALTLAIIVNSLFIINQRLDNISVKSGIDEDNTLMISFSSLSDSYNMENAIANDLAFLKSLPGVNSAMATNSLPLSNSGWSSGVSSQSDYKGVEIGSAFYFADETLVDTLGVDLIAGRSFRSEEISYYYLSDELEPPVCIVSADLALTLFPDLNNPEEVVGKKIWYGGVENPKFAEVIGVINDIKAPWRGWSEPIFNRVIYVPHKPIFGKFSRYVVRAENGQLDNLVKNIQTELSNFDDQRVIRPPRPFSDIREVFVRNDKGMATTLTIVIVLLLLINALGIIGLVSFWVTQRTKQIGTRRALGATKFDILTYFLTENLIITCIGVIIGSILAMALNNWLVTAFSLSKLPMSYLLGSALLLILMGMIAVCAPAMRAMNVQPAVATRSV
ncbi:ABC transporter permease [Sessilibacter corallicola]|uniref:ABC transporter permease n=1 Tax=Sessilibacter corallicola TaxID=2904075 RepID=UPI001E3593F5|nr:FtsX-like permease family protein [Sessilibacter corallicola]MCE2029325.1 FtsX-like permease family protein [Sessilibacter corallicola]